MSEFEPKNVDAPIDEIIPESQSDINISVAQEECAEVSEKLGATVSGIGPKAAERYLLRYEYGFRPMTIAEEYGVTSPTVTNQTSDVRQRILRHPKLAQTVGQFRSKRAGLKKPVSSGGSLWDGQLRIKSVDIDGQVGVHLGSFLTGYSWKYTLQAKTQVENKTRHLTVDYLIYDELGILLKRSLRGISNNSWQRPPYFGPKWRYTVYPLPNPNIPTDDGTLSNAVEYHVVYDMARAFADEYVEQDWTALEMDANLNMEGGFLAPQVSLPEVLLDRLDGDSSINAIHEYSQVVHLRKNVERLLRFYPLTTITQIPLDTIELLWDGPLTYPETDDPGTDVLEYALESFRIVVKPGDRFSKNQE